MASWIYFGVQCAARMKENYRNPCTEGEASTALVVAEELKTVKTEEEYEAKNTLTSFSLYWLHISFSIDKQILSRDQSFFS